jgi:integrase
MPTFVWKNNRGYAVYYKNSNGKISRPTVPLGKFRRKCDGFVEYQKHIDFSSSEKDKKILFSELVPKYLEFSKITKSKITHEGNVKHLKPLLEEFGNLRLDQITSERLEQFRLEFKPKGGKSWKPTTWRNRLGLLKQILDYGKNHGYKTADPFSTVKIPRPQIWEFEPRITTKEVITDFFSVLEPRYIPAAKIMRYTGLRPAELYRLTPDDIDYDKKIIIVRRNGYDFCFKQER